MTGDPHTNIAAGLGDIVLLTVLRGCLVLLPLLGIPAALSWLGVSLTALAEAGMSAYLAVKAVFAYQLAHGRKFLVADTGVTYHVPTLIAAELLGVFMTWFMFALVSSWGCCCSWFWQGTEVSVECSSYSCGWQQQELCMAFCR